MNAMKVGWIVCGLTAIIATVALQQVPDGMQLPLHWNIEGKPDDIGPAWKGLFMPPFVIAIILCVFSALKYIEPRQENLKHSNKAMGGIAFAVVVLMLIMEAGYVSMALGENVPMIRLVTFGVGLMFAIIGNFLSKTRSNFFIGIRTPWTLSSDEVWRKTHRIGGRLFIVGGLLLAIGVWIVSEGYLIPLIIISAVTSGIIPVAYSWWLWRCEQRAGNL